MFCFFKFSLGLLGSLGLTWKILLEESKKYRFLKCSFFRKQEPKRAKKTTSTKLFFDQSQTPPELQSWSHWDKNASDNQKLIFSRKTEWEWEKILDNNISRKKTNQNIFYTKKNQLFLWLLKCVVKFISVKSSNVNLFQCVQLINKNVHS